MIKWINSVTETGNRADVVEQGSEEERKAKRETKLVDVAHEYMRANSKSLDGLVRIGGAGQEREELKGKVRKKVWDTVDENLGTVDGGMVEEITERVVDAAEADPFYKRMFEEDRD
ncbi:MAG: hypothetical protein JXA24_01655 [Proteobacteria bacterium]|nr:hypothetical protein [Pseudomonadota bacterium]